jgi:copper chaperone
MLTSVTLEVTGDQRLVCEGCEQRVERVVKALQGVDQVRARARKQRIEVLFDDEVLEPGTITEQIPKAGYETTVVTAVSVPAPRSAL